VSPPVRLCARKAGTTDTTLARVIRCRFTFSGKNDGLTPDFLDTGFPPDFLGDWILE